MKQKLMAFAFVATFGLSYSYTQAQQDETQEFGFFMKNGETKKKITEINCYSFDELWVKFPITPEMFGYDNVVIRVYQLSNNGSVHQRAGYGFDGSVFRAKFAGKQEEEMILFRKGAQEHAFKTGGLSRGLMKYGASKGALEGATMVIEILGQTITGYAEEIVGNRVVRQPTYSSADLLYKSDKIVLKNRERKIVVNLPIGGQVGSLDVDLSVPCGNE